MLVGGDPVAGLVENGGGAGREWTSVRGGPAQGSGDDVVADVRPAVRGDDAADGHHCVGADTHDLTTTSFTTTPN